MIEENAEYVARSLEVARQLVAAGVPVFCALPDPAKPIGFDLPRGWQRADAVSSRRAIDMWQPGMALCAVMGHTLDLIDFDPRSGTPDGEFTAWPTAYATASTPSGGTHAFIASLRVGSRDNILSGVDIKGGRPDGEGRGFAFIAPTVRASKVDGSLKAYEWTQAPDLHKLAARAAEDHSGSALAALVAGKLSSNGNGTRASTVAWNQPSTDLAVFRPPARTFTREQAQAYCDPWIRALREAPDGERNYRLNQAAKVLSHFAEPAGFWTDESAWQALIDAVPPKEYGVRSWDARATIASAWRSAARDWRAELVEQGATFPGTALLGQSAPGVNGAVVANRTRWIDPEPWLSGTYQPPAPTRGAIRGDGKPLLYPAAWHTVIGSTGAGKSWLAVAHARDELLSIGDRPAGLVAYAHFEESTMASTIARLQAIGLSNEVIRERFVWLDCNERWAPGEMAEQLARLPMAPTLLLLDGINSACTTHGQDPATVAAVGWYRAMFVMPATALGAAVVSLGHPPKASDRQAERHGFGSTAWLDEVDGCGFRLVAGNNPIRKGASGAAQLYSVKDRHGGIEEGAAGYGKREGWTYLGTLVVDDSAAGDAGRTEIRVAPPRPGGLAEDMEPIEALAEAIVAVLAKRADRAYANQAELIVELRENGIKLKTGDMAPALLRLEKTGRLHRDPPPARLGASWGGQLVAQTTEDKDE